MLHILSHQRNANQNNCETALLGFEVDCFLIFWEIDILISKAVVQIYSPLYNEWVFPLLHILFSIKCHQYIWSWLFWQVSDGISELFWSAFLWWLRMFPKNAQSYHKFMCSIKLIVALFITVRTWKYSRCHLIKE